MSDEREEDRGHTARCLDVDFSGEYGVRVTSRELMKNGMTGTMSSEGFTTGGLGGTPWRKEVSASLETRGYVSMTSGGAGHGRISQL
jgi:hypothetical protein